ncbi:MAG TPA: tRNA lysidine(34) synthetase TilS [Gemmata sp.]|nr:tRNA lysidine(34) synthetase TilS [Gemmata sp.]
MRALWEVRRFMETLPNGKASGVVAVSGGADSVALLRTLQSLYPGALTVAHINHQLRGVESDGDEAFVRELAGQLALTCLVKAVDVGVMAAGANLEATARRVRYEFFAEVAASVGASWIATGHTADDQAETVLHRLIRGTGMQGLRGIARRNSPIVRPLLAVARAEVIEYLSSLNQSFREDSSNVDPRFTRNRLRHELIPLLKTFNPAIVTALGQIASQAGEAFEFLEADAASWMREVEMPRAGDQLILDATKLEAAHPYRVRELLRLLWQREGWPITDMTADHWSRLVAVAQGSLTAVDFPEGISARRVSKVLQIGK